jgi:DNA-binding CsgD family transcriptional regulator
MLSAKHVDVARASGALAPLSIALNARGVVMAWFGDFEAATAIVAEHDAVNEATGIGGWVSAGGLLLAAFQGRSGALELMTATVDAAVEGGVGHGAQHARWTTAILCNGLGRYAEAAEAARVAAYEMTVPNGTGWALIELIEAAQRSRQPDVARDAMQRLPDHTLESDWAFGVEARSRALVTDDADAEGWYVEATRRLEGTPFRTEVARTHLLFGEWLRRQGRRVDARNHLRAAHEMFASMGADAFEERARRELLATGERVRKRSADREAREVLTPQEEHVARLARDGRSNSEIGAELFLSVRTVEWHLRKIFIKLGVTSRRDLKNVLPARAFQPRH